MKKLLLICCTLFASTTLYAANCDTIKDDIASKIRANGVTDFTLEVVDKGTYTDREVVGSCSRGTKDIVYQRNMTNMMDNNSIENTTPMNNNQATPEQ